MVVVVHLAELEEVRQSHLSTARGVEYYSRGQRAIGSRSRQGIFVLSELLFARRFVRRWRLNLLVSYPPSTFAQPQTGQRLGCQSRLRFPHNHQECRWAIDTGLSGSRKHCDILFAITETQVAILTGGVLAATRLLLRVVELLIHS